MGARLRELRRVGALLALTLLACGLLSTSASARVLGAAMPAAGGVAPKITKQPVSVTVEEGQTAVFESTATGTPEPTVRWEVSSDGGSTWRRIAHSSSDQLTVADTKTSENDYEYRAVFENEATGQGKGVVSQAATLTVLRFPAVTKQPAGMTVDEGQGVVFEATASGFPTPTVQWELSTNGGGTWSAVPGATTDLLAIASTRISENGDEYRAAFTNGAGTVSSAAATLTVRQPPAVTGQPSAITVADWPGVI